MSPHTTDTTAIFRTAPKPTDSSGSTGSTESPSSPASPATTASAPPDTLPAAAAPRPPHPGGIGDIGEIGNATALTDTAPAAHTPDAHMPDTPIPADFRLNAYTYPLPEEQIAQHPADRRGASRLFVVDRTTGRNTCSRFADLADWLPPGALLVANNSKVLPARLYGTRPSGGRVEFLLLTPLPFVMEQAVPAQSPPVRTQADQAAPHAHGWHSAPAEGLLRMSKRVKPGEQVTFGPNLRLEVTAPGEFGRCAVRLFWHGDLKALFLAQGHLPLPPYIKRPTDTPGSPDSAEDRERYQTVYAREERLGSVAAPTAGLHFTDAQRADLARQGFGWAEVTLYVGYGTFSPVRSEDIRQHVMHREYMEISPETAHAIRTAKAEGRPVVTVGTTSTRVLEGAFAQTGTIGPFSGWTDIFIYPGFTFKVTDHVITNFHLPESSLLMMVSALAGRERMLQAYAEAIGSGFRVFSYGDSMLIL